MWNKLLTIFVLTEVVLGAVVEENLVTTSFEFLDKYTQKQYRNIVNVTISNASINKIDPKLKYLKHLKYLDLSHNYVQISSIPKLNNLKVLKLNDNSLKSINMSLLPQNIEELDLSNNLLSYIPKDWRNLKSLKIIHLHKNPMDCDCNNVLIYDSLVKSGIKVPESITCSLPKKFSGKDIATVSCSQDDIMLYDEPEEGSGSADIFQDNVTDTKNIPLIEEEEPKSSIAIVDDLIEVHTTTEESSTPEQMLDEGSGDEGSGFVIALPESGILGCIVNCRTPEPVGIHDEEHDSPLPSPLDQFKILMDDLNPFKKFDDVTTTKSTTTTTSTTTTIITEKPMAKEPRMFKETDGLLESGRSSDKEVEIINNSSSIHELERASSAPQNTNAVYAIAAIFSFLAILFVICFIKKRRANHRNKKNRRDDANTPGEEMKPLSKPNVQSINEKPVKNAQNIPEHIPLINGQNGARKGDSPVLKSYTPLAHPEKLDRDDEPIQQNGQMIPETDEVEIRPKQPELLTPQTERVTIRESEIPEAIPRTPLLVHRQKNSDGEIVTTVVP